MKKRILATILMILLLPLTGCIPNKPAVIAPSPVVSEPVNIWHYWGNAVQQQAQQKMVDEYNQSQSRYSVYLTYIPFDDFLKKLSVSAVEHTLPDVAIIAVPDHTYFASIGLFADLTDRFDFNNYFPASVASCEYQDRIYGVPFGANCLALFCNMQYFQKENLQPPTNWEELKSTAKKLTKDGVKGFGFANIQSEEGTFNDLVWLYSAGTDENHIGSEAGIHALTLVKDLIDDGSVSRDIINANQAEIMEQFGRGELAMMINGPWQIPMLKSNYPDIEYQVSLLPKGAEYASVLGGENYAVISGGNEAGALEFIRYATDAKRLQSLMDSFCYISADQSVSTIQFRADPAMQVFVRQMQFARTRGPNTEWPSISAIISKVFTDVIIGQAEPSQAAMDAQKKMSKILQAQ